MFESMRHGKLPDSNRFAETPTRRFYLSDNFCDIALVDSNHDFPDKRRSTRVLPDLWSASPPRRPPVVQAPLDSLANAALAMLLPSTGASYNTGASSQRSRPVPRPVVLDVLTLLSWWCCRAGWFPYFLAGGYRSVLYPNSRLISLGSCSGYEVLEPVRSVVSYTLALSSKCSRPVVSPASFRTVR